MHRRGVRRNFEPALGDRQPTMAAPPISYALTNDKGSVQVRITNYGGVIVSIDVLGP